MGTSERERQDSPGYHQEAAVVEAARRWVDEFRAGRFFFAVGEDRDAVAHVGRISAATAQLVDAVEELDR